MADRWMCPCGRFVAAADIEERSRLAGGSVVTEARYRCSRCGVRNDLPWFVDTTGPDLTGQEQP